MTQPEFFRTPVQLPASPTQPRAIHLLKVASEASGRSPELHLDKKLQLYLAGRRQPRAPELESSSKEDNQHKLTSQSSPSGQHGASIHGPLHVPRELPQLFPRLSDAEDQQPEFQDPEAPRRGTSSSAVRAKSSQQDRIPVSLLTSESDLASRTCTQGGFSYVYLVQDTSTSELFALKKIRCPFGAESVAQAMREVDAYKLFSNTPGIIHSIDYAIASERGGGEMSKTVYVLLPYYRRGNLQDLINANLVNHTTFPEKRLMQLFLGVCRALREMHVYAGSSGPAGGPGERMEMRVNGVDENVAAASKGRSKRGTPQKRSGADEDDEAEQQRPLMHGTQEGVPEGNIRSYAHRDIKPG